VWLNRSDAAVDLESAIEYHEMMQPDWRTDMAKWQYMTLIYGTADKQGRRWMITPANGVAEGKQVGENEKSRFIGRICQALRLLETALTELDAEGWELVSTSCSGIWNFYGTAVLRLSAKS